MEDFAQQPGGPWIVPWKLIAIIVAVVVVVAAIAGGAWWYVRSQHQQLIVQSDINRASQQLDQTLATCDAATNPDGCKQQQVEQVAGALGSVQICTKLDGDLLDNCAWGVAIQKLNADDCDPIPDAAKRQSCADSVHLQLAINQTSLDECGKISSQVAKDRCTTTVSDAIASSRGCDNTGVDPSICADRQAYATAVASGDPAQCDTLTNADDAANCHDGLGSGDKDHDKLSADFEAQLGTSDTNPDTDGDGLTDYDEHFIWGTDPTNPDTDGDGFSDGEEVSGGYNPLGPGKL